MLKQCVRANTEWRKWDLLTACAFYWTGSSDANNEAAASLSVCLPGRKLTTKMPFILFRYTEVADWHVPVHECQHTQHNRLVESSGVGRVAADVFWYRLFTGDSFCSPPIQNAEHTKTHSPRNNIAKTGDQPVDGSGYQKLWDICCFSFDRLVFQHMGWVMRRGRRLCMADSCQHKSCGFLTICLGSQCLTIPLWHDDITNLDMSLFVICKQNVISYSGHK